MKKERISFRIYNLLLCFLVTVGIILLCLAVHEAEQRWYLKLDVSESRLSELSEYTKSRLDAMTQDVTLYPVWRAGSSDSLHDLQTETLYRMAAAGSHIAVRELNPDTQPQILLSLCGDTADVPDGTVFIRNNNGTGTVRLENSDFLFSRRIDGEIYTVYCGEARLIGAIDAVCSDDPTAVWFITGHGEKDRQTCSMLALTVQSKGFPVYEADLNTMRPKPDDILLLIGPEQDFTAKEAGILASFLDDGGRLIAAVGADTPFDRMNRLASVLDLYGLSWQGGWVAENEAESARYADRPEFLVPVLSGDFIRDELPGRMILPRSTALGRPAQRPGIESGILLTTSGRAVRRTDINSDLQNVLPQDITGEQILAVSAEGSGSMCILLFGSVDMLLDNSVMDSLSVQDSSENLAFVSSCLDSMAGLSVGATLDAGVKRLSAQLIAFDNARQQQQISILFLTGLPGTILLVMIIVLLRRRRL